MTTLPWIDKYSRDTCGYVLQKGIKLLNTGHITAGLLNIVASAQSLKCGTAGDVRPGKNEAE